MSPISRTGLLAGRRVPVVPRYQRSVSPPDLQVFCKALERRIRPCRSDSFVSRTPSPQSALSDLLRQCTDSPDTSLAKPPTPPPTLVSRRCYTPDRSSPRARLVLDLRRSRSHDKLDSASTVVTSRHETPVKSVPAPSKVIMAAVPPATLSVPPPPHTIHVEQPPEEGAISKRRGKKLKRKKCGKASEKGFQGLSEPEKTQVSTLEVAEDKEGTSVDRDGDAGRQGRLTTPHSFLDHDLLQYLHRGLNSASIQCEVRLKRKVALEETARVLGLPDEVDDMGLLQEDIDKQSGDEPTDSLSQLPRTSALEDSVFLLPMDTRLLHKLSPLDYLRTHTMLSKSGVALYRRIYCKLSRGRVLPQKHMQTALSQVVGRSLDEEDVASLQSQLGWTSDVDFCTWCGIAAAVERLACIRPVGGHATPSSEIERADMTTLERYLATLPPVQPCPPLASFLRSLTRLSDWYGVIFEVRFVRLYLVGGA